MTISVRHALVGLAATALLAAPARAAVNPLDRVPADAGLFAHLEAGDLWNHPAVSSLRKAYPKEIEKALQTVETETGLRPEQIDRITFHWPKLPMGPGDEALFVLQVTTKAPYAKDTLLKGLRPKDAKAGGDLIPLREKMVLQLTTDRQFTVLHESLLGEFQKGASKTTDGVLADALKTARAGKHALVVGFDPSGLPAEIFTAAPPELQPFLPLLKSRSITLTADLDKDLTASLRFAQENEDKAIDAERSFNLLMKLADDAITTGLGDGAREKDFEALKPALTEVQKAVRRVKAKRTGTTVTAEASLRADPLLAKPIVQLFLKPQMASARARSSNNLKQIGLAMHNYHDMNGVFPAAAIVNKKGKPLLSWRVAILPYIEQENLYKQFKLDEPWDSEHNKKFIPLMPRTLRSPRQAAALKDRTTYLAPLGKGLMWDDPKGLKITQVTDGTSNTIALVEADDDRAVIWSKPEDVTIDRQNPATGLLGHYVNGFQAAMADGSVRFIPKGIDPAKLWALFTRAGGEAVGK
jgi:hypothetical protein